MVSGVLIRWIANFLSNLKDRVILNGIFSAFADVHCGVPQDSILLPTVFCIFLNDHLELNLSCEIYSYTDDRAPRFSYTRELPC